MSQQIKGDNNPVTLEELVWQESFRKWVRHPTPVLNRHWQSWKDQHPQQIDVLTEARQVVLALNVKNRPITDEAIRYVTGQCKKTIMDSSIVEFIKDSTHYAQQGITNAGRAFAKSLIGQRDGFRYNTARKKANFLRSGLDCDLLKTLSINRH